MNERNQQRRRPANVGTKGGKWYLQLQKLSLSTTLKCIISFLSRFHFDCCFLSLSLSFCANRKWYICWLRVILFDWLRGCWRLKSNCRSSSSGAKLMWYQNWSKNREKKHVDVIVARWSNIQNLISIMMIIMITCIVFFLRKFIIIITIEIEVRRERGGANNANGFLIIFSLLFIAMQCSRMPMRVLSHYYFEYTCTMIIILIYCIFWTIFQIDLIIYLYIYVHIDWGKTSMKL